MMKIFFLTLCCLMAACSIAPPNQPARVAHDLGAQFEPLAGKDVPLSQIRVSAGALSSGLSMAYRQAGRPTERSVYAFNRWAVRPADLLEDALGRLLPVSAGVPCRLDFLLADFILEIAPGQKSAAYLSGSLKLSGVGRAPLLVRRVDIRVPVEKAGPQALALGQAEAARQLAGEVAAWLATDLPRACQTP